MRDLFENEQGPDDGQQKIDISTILSAIHNDKDILKAVADKIGAAPDRLNLFLINNITYTNNRFGTDDSKQMEHSETKQSEVKKNDNADSKNIHAKAILHTDGGSRGNPGIAGCGVAIDYDDGSHKGYYYYIGTKTNNEAEYNALIYGLSLLSDEGVREVEAFADSELMCNQINGTYKVKNGNLLGLYENARRLISKFASFKITHVLRSMNKEADKLANMAMDKKENGEIEHTVAG